MHGAVCGDVIGSVYELINIKHTEFPILREDCRFTDDTVLTIAVADAIMNNLDYADTIRRYGREHPLAGYGSAFITWLDDPNAGPYNSWGNGSAMRVSAVAWLFDSMEEVLEHAKLTAEVTHNHPEGIKGAQAIASAVFMARQNGETKASIKKYIEETFGYDLDRTIDEIRPTYEFSARCEDTVPEAIIAFLESTDYEDCIRKAISIGGDSDTIAAMAGSIAHPFHGKIPDEIVKGVSEIIHKVDNFVEIFEQFSFTVDMNEYRCDECNARHSDEEAGCLYCGDYVDGKFTKFEKAKTEYKKKETK
jgi:ADP-ribosylglycohydrolase